MLCLGFILGLMREKLDVDYILPSCLASGHRVNEVELNFYDEN